MNNKQAFSNETKRSINRITKEISKIENELSSEKDQANPIVILLLKYLSEIKLYLSTEILNKKDIEQYSFGIFRVVTDDWNFEQSKIGKKLLDLCSEIDNLSKQI